MMTGTSRVASYSTVAAVEKEVKNETRRRTHNNKPRQKFQNRESQTTSKAEKEFQNDVRKTVEENVKNTHNKARNQTERFKESKVIVDTVANLDLYIRTNKYTLSKEETIHEFFKMMKLVSVYYQVNEGMAIKKMIALIYSISKTCLKILGNNKQNLRDIYNLLCLVSFKNFPSLHIPFFQLVYGFRAVGDTESCLAIFEDHIRGVVGGFVDRGVPFYSDYLLAADLCMPVFSVTHEDLVDLILSWNAKVIPKGAFGCTGFEMENNFDTILLPKRFGLFGAVKFFSEQIFEYMKSIETKSIEKGAFDSNLFLKSIKKIHQMGLYLDSHKYNYALNILAKNESPYTLQFFEEIQQMDHVKTDTGTYCTLMKYYGKILSENDEPTLSKIYEEIVSNRLSNQHLLTTILSITKKHAEAFSSLREKVVEDLSKYEE